MNDNDNDTVEHVDQAGLPGTATAEQPRAAGRGTRTGTGPDVAVTVQQTAHPRGFPTAADFAFVESPIPGPAPGSALVRNLYWSVDPYHREMMDDLPGGFGLGVPLEGRTVGRVVASRTPALAEGDLVLHRQGWRTHAVVTPEETRRLPRVDGVPPSVHLSILGGTGLTAYVGLTRIARLQQGEDLYVSGAAGGVGTATGRFARLLGAGRIVGSAGSAAKVDHLVREVGYDAAFDYHDGPAADLLGKVAPDGIDVFVDNVGGEQLAAAVGALREFGRIVRVGTISRYNNPDAPPPLLVHEEVVEKSLRIEGFLVRNYRDLQKELHDFAVPHLRSGRLVPDETVVDGFEHLVDAFLGMLHGRNVGKIVVRDRSEVPAGA